MTCIDRSLAYCTSDINCAKFTKIPDCSAFLVYSLLAGAPFILEYAPSLFCLRFNDK